MIARRKKERTLYEIFLFRCRLANLTMACFFLIFKYNFYLTEAFSKMIHLPSHKFIYQKGRLGFFLIPSFLIYPHSNNFFY